MQFLFRNPIVNEFWKSVTFWIRQWKDCVAVFMTHSVYNSVYVVMSLSLPYAVSCGRFCFGTVSLCFCLCMKYLGPLNRFASNSHGRCVCPLLGRVWKSRSKVKVTRDKNSIFRPFRQAACGFCLVKHLDRLVLSFSFLFLLLLWLWIRVVWIK